jgi:hypothetical protein
MRRTVFASILLALVLGTAAPPARAKEAPADPPAAKPGDRIDFLHDVGTAFRRAQEQHKPVMICINAKRVDNRAREERAAKALREKIYLDPRVVAKSRRFVCVFLTSEGSSSDYGELRARFGIEGIIFSPQHIFARPDHKTGERPLLRKEGWSYGAGDAAVKALLGMMDQALEAFGTKRVPAPEETPPAGGSDAAPAAPQDGSAAKERAAWIAQLLAIVRESGSLKRQEALRSLVANDRNGDCIQPLVALLGELKEDKEKVGAVTDIVRSLGIPGLEGAAAAMADLLRSRDDTLRANVAVSLEYIGSKESVGELLKRAPRERSEVIANHMYRALGRCGAGESKVRNLLARKARSAKSELAAYGPIVGLAYFEKDAKAARDVEKLLGSMGPPSFGRRGGRGANTMKRSLLAWTLSQIRDPKSAAFVRQELLKPLEHVQSRWLKPVVDFYEAVARTCEGDKDAAGAVDTGVRRALEFSGGTGQIRDAARRERDTSRFEPKADWDLQARTWGRGRGGGGNGGNSGGGGR